MCVRALIRGPGPACSVPNEGWWWRRRRWMHGGSGGNCERKNIITSKGKAREVSENEIRKPVPARHQDILPVAQAQTSSRSLTCSHNKDREAAREKSKGRRRTRPGVNDLVRPARVHLALDAWMALMKAIAIAPIQGTLSYGIPTRARSRRHRMIGDRMVKWRLKRISHMEGRGR